MQNGLIKWGDTPLMLLFLSHISIKWGDTPLALLFLSPISMFSFTFLISTALGVL